MSISEHEAKVLSDFETYETELAALRARVAELERERDAAKADAARLREALERYGDHHPCCDYAERALYEDCACGFRDALASGPSAEPAPRDMRVAEAVREAYDRAIIVHGRLAAGAIDLTAVVAKALEVGT